MHTKILGRVSRVKFPRKLILIKKNFPRGITWYQNVLTSISFSRSIEQLESFVDGLRSNAIK